MKKKTNVIMAVKPDHATSETIASWDMSRHEKGALVWDTTESILKTYTGDAWIPSDGSVSDEDKETLSHFRYNPVTDTLEADRSIETTLSSLYLGKQHGIHSAGENVVFTNESTGVNWSPIWLGITKTQEYKATTRQYS